MLLPAIAALNKSLLAEEINAIAELPDKMMPKRRTGILRLMILI